MRKRQKSIVDKSESTKSFLTKTASIVKIIRVELLIASIGLILSLGQYFQNSINVRINITTTWRLGYTSETRDRVNRFIYVKKNWKAICENKKLNSCDENLKNAIDILADNENLYQLNSKEKTELKKNAFIEVLVENEIAAIKRDIAKKTTEAKKSEDDIAQNGKVSKANEASSVTNEEYIEILLKYRNSIIECLNTLEAVKAVIQSKPLPFRLTIFYKDTLEGRYRDIIEELKIGLMDFIVAYRESRPDRETEAWYVLTSDESYLNDLVNVTLYFLIFIASLYSVYVIKKRIYTAGYLNEL